MEKLRSTRMAAALALAASIALGGCAPSGHTAEQEVIGRCYDQLQPLPAEPEMPSFDSSSLPPLPDLPPVPATGILSPDYDEALDEYYTELDAYNTASDRAYKEFEEALDAYDQAIDPADITVAVDNGVAEGDSVYVRDDVLQSTMDPTVYIATTGYTGSGVVVLNDDGEQVVVTAAHLAGEAYTSSISIETFDGQTQQVKSGCYIYEGTVLGGNNSTDRQDRMRNPADEQVVSYDVAVLVPEQPLDVTPAVLSDASVKPGDWLNFVNYQGPFVPPTEVFYGGNVVPGPAAYTGLVTPQTPGKTTIDVVAGLSNRMPTQLSVGYDDNHVTSGSSGGPVFNRDGEVIGIVRSSKDPEQLDVAELREDNNLNLVGAPADLQPNPADITPIGIIQTAIDATERQHTDAASQ